MIRVFEQSLEVVNCLVGRRRTGRVNGELAVDVKADGDLRKTVAAIVAEKVDRRIHGQTG